MSASSDDDFENFSWKKIGFRHLLGIVFMPYIFGWPVVLKDGYSKVVKTVVGVWMAPWVLYFASAFVTGIVSGGAKHEQPAGTGKVVESQAQPEAKE